jgi:hypothetical protein
MSIVRILHRGPAAAACGSGNSLFLATTGGEGGGGGACDVDGSAATMARYYSV